MAFNQSSAPHGSAGRARIASNFGEMVMSKKRQELDEEELDAILWRCANGSHFETAFLGGSLYAKQVVEEDAPRMVAEIRHLRRVIAGLK